MFQQRQGLFISSLIAVFFALAPARTLADCSAPGGVHLNEIRFIDAYAPSETHLNPMVELFNKNAFAVDLTGWNLTDAGGAPTAVLPAVNLPGGAFLQVVHGTGVNDLDFSDGIGVVFTNGDSTGIYNKLNGGVGLYDGVPAPANMVDFVAWGENAVAVPGTALTDAQTAGLWSGSDAVPVTGDMLFFTIRLLPDGADNDTPTDWVHYGWADSDHHANVPGSNAAQVDPQPGMGFESGTLTVAWAVTTDPASRYHLVVATDSTLASGIVVNDTLDYPASDTTIVLADGLYYYRVTVLDGCGESPAGPIWDFTVFPGPVPAPPSDWQSGMELAPAAASVLNVPRILQHKDTQLLCIWNSKFDEKDRPGCTETAGNNGPWDGPHPANHAERRFEVNFLGRVFKWTRQCPHCRNYCARAATQSLNQFYGGNLTQDHIAYQFMSTAPGGWTVASPEGDLGHDRTTPVAGVITVTQWALNNSTMTGPFRPASYANLKAEIQAGFPARISQPGHASLVDGFVDTGAFFGILPKADFVHIVDPWPTSRTNGWRAANRVNILQYWKLRKANPANPITGRMEDATVSTDSDGDGVMDFDEGYPDYPATRPRRFHSRPDRMDTDGDEINDKEEIRSYTFHDTDHPGHENDPLSFPDVDGDGLRAELDCDTDGDMDFDGGEDLNGNGKAPEPGETCVFFNGDDNLQITMDKAVYQPGETHKMNGETFHANSVYEYFVYNMCPNPLTAQDDLADYYDNGVVSSDADGKFPLTAIGSYPPGCYTVILDVLKDDLYGVEVNKPGGGTTVGVCDVETEFTVEDNPTPVNGLLSAHGTGDGAAHVEWNLDGAPLAVQVERSLSPQGAYAVVGAPAVPQARDAFVDRTLLRAGTYWYRLTVTFREERRTLGPVQVTVEAPPLALHAHSNPFAGETSFLLMTPSVGRVQVKVYSINGRLIRDLVDEERPMGPGLVHWDGRDAQGAAVSQGVYFVVARHDLGRTSLKVVKQN